VDRLPAQTERYRTVDLPFYSRAVSPVLPPAVLDFHAHLWQPSHWRQEGDDTAPARYMVTERDYPREALLADAARLFPDRRYEAVAFGQPTALADTELTNRYVAESCAAPPLYPLRVTGRGETPPSKLRTEMLRSPFFGYKVRIPWVGNEYGQVTVADMIGPSEMEVADELRLVVLLHVPGAERLADPRVQRDVARYAEAYPGASIVLAHCGRCYHPDRMEAAVGALRDMENVYLDTAMVMDPTVLQMAFEAVGPSRVLYATDLPVAAMRGRRVYVMDHWVDVVLPGYPESAFRVASSQLRATFMAWEIALAIRRAARMARLTEESLRGVFHRNGMSLLRRVMDGQKLADFGRGRTDEP